MAAPQRRLSIKELEAFPADLLSAMLQEVETELKTCRRAAAAEGREYEQVQLRVRKLEEALAAATTAAAQRRQRDARAADAAERTARLLRAARRRGQEYEAAIAKTLEEIEQLRRSSSSSGGCGGVVGGDGAISPTSLSVIAPEREEMPSMNSSTLQRDVDVASAKATTSHIGFAAPRIDAPESPSNEVSRVVAAVRAANAEQQRSVLQHALAHRVTRVERENAMLRRCIDVLQRGDASSAKLYHELERMPPSTSV